MTNPTPPPTNKAAWSLSQNGPIAVLPAPMPTPGPGQLLLRNHAIALNPADHKMHDTGLFVHTWPTILGLDCAGEVLALGPDVTGFGVGQRVLGEGCRLGSGNVAEAAFQQYTAVAALLACPIPEGMSYAEAAVLPLSVSTAAAGLYEEDKLHLPLPTTARPEGGKGTLLVWGGSSSVGCSGIQLARASGLDVVSTASAENVAFVKSLGARAVFDHKSPTVVEDIVAEMKRGPASVGCLDCIGRPYTTGPVAEILSRLGGGAIASVGLPLETLPEKVSWTRIHGSTPKDNFVGKAVFADFLPEALRAKTFLPLPEPRVVGTGLEAVEGAVNILRAGVSRTKIVVKL